ncbi:MAG: radical SAM protein [Bacillota bacterium]
MRCLECDRESPLIAEILGVCADCIRNRFARVRPRIEAAHRLAREEFGLPPFLPRAEEGVNCQICANACRIPEGGLGYCGLRTNRQGRLVHFANAKKGSLTWYYDPLPTNCVAAWACGEKDARRGKNLAVFYHGCGFDCLFCQNWHHREEVTRLGRKAGRREEEAAEDVFITPENLLARVDKETKCICFFGGDPVVQLPHSLAVARLAVEQKKVRVCWETSGGMNPSFLPALAETALSSGGMIKFDLKAASPEIHFALCGVGNERTLANFAALAEYGRTRRDPPLLVAATLLVPGYVDRREVGEIARFIASLDPEIPYTLLAFHPAFYLADLPPTSRPHAEECLAEAREAGLKRVRLGNVHLLGRDY